MSEYIEWNVGARGYSVQSREGRNTLKLLSSILLVGAALNMGFSKKAIMLAGVRGLQHCFKYTNDIFLIVISENIRVFAKVLISETKLLSG